MPNTPDNQPTQPAGGQPSSAPAPAPAPILGGDFTVRTHPRMQVFRAARAAWTALDDEGTVDQQVPASTAPGQT